MCDPRSIKFDCLTCGLCCVSLSSCNKVWAQVTPTEQLLLGPEWCATNVLEKDGVAGIRTKFRRMSAGPFKGIEFNACIALDGTIMHKTSCSIYATRPYICVAAVSPGDSTCRALRVLFLETLNMYKSKKRRQNEECAK